MRMEQDKPKVAILVTKSRTTLDPALVAGFPERVVATIGQVMARAGLEQVGVTRDGYELRLSLDGPSQSLPGGPLSLKVDLFLLQAETQKRIATETHSSRFAVEGTTVERALAQHLGKLAVSDAMKRITAEVQKDIATRAEIRRKRQG
jgi:hypothetical protein